MGRNILSSHERGSVAVVDNAGVDLSVTVGSSPDSLGVDQTKPAHLGIRTVNPALQQSSMLRSPHSSSSSSSYVSCILWNCRNLEVLDIGCCHEITDLAFQGIKRGGFEARLKVLKASNCPRITVSGISVLLEFCKHLQYLDVTSCPHVTAEGCEQAGLQFPEPCKVNFTGSLLERDALAN